MECCAKVVCRSFHFFANAHVACTPCFPLLFAILVVDSFKRHPITDLALACEACLLIRPQDELVAIDHQNLKGIAL